MTMNDWVHARARSGGEVKVRIFGEDEAATSGQGDQKSDAPKHPNAYAGAGCGETPRDKPDMDAFIRGRIRRR